MCDLVIEVSRMVRAGSVAGVMAIGRGSASSGARGSGERASSSRSALERIDGNSSDAARHDTTRESDDWHQVSARWC
jgi:hypothetical protein